MKNHYLRKKLSLLLVSVMIATSSITVFASDYAGHWAEGPITRWSKEGVVEGYEDGTFGPSRAVTRGELATFIARVFGLTDMTKAKEYTDISSSSWYTQPVNAVSSLGTMNDYGDEFRPDQPATREEAAHALANAFRLSGESTKEFADEEFISNWAKDSVNALINHGILKGKSSNMISPKDTLTRAEIVSMLDRLASGFYGKEGTYTTDANGNVVVNTAGVTLADMVITGNLYIGQGVGEGDVTLDNVTVEETVFIDGGGENSIKFKNSSKARNVEVAKPNGKVRIVVDADSILSKVNLASGAKLEGDFNKVIVATKQPVTFVSGIIETLEISSSAADVIVILEEKALVKELEVNASCNIQGKGKIDKAFINVAGVKLETKPKEIILKEGIKASIGGKEYDGVTTDKPPTGGSPSDGSSGGGGGTVAKPSAVVTPAKLFQSEIIKAGRIEVEINLRNTRLTTESHQELAGAISDTSNIWGGSNVDIVNSGKFTYMLWPRNASDLPLEWVFTIPGSLLSTGKDIHVSVPIVADVEGLTPEEKVEIVENKISEDVSMSIDGDGDNLMEKLKDMTNSDALGVNLSIEVLEEDYKQYISEDGAITYPEDSIEEAIAVNVTIECEGISAIKFISVYLDPLSNEPELPEGITERLTTTPGAITISDGETVEFIITTGSAIFIDNVSEDAWVSSENSWSEVRTWRPIMSEDRKSLTFKAIFVDVKSGERVSFYIPAGWFEDGKARATELITIKKK